MASSDPDNLSICSQVEEVIRCAICWDVPLQPKILPCQHSFCLRCIEPAYFSNIQQKIQPKGKVQCPMCRHTHHVPKKGLVALPTDHKTNSLKDIVQKKRHIQSIRLCSMCTVQKRYTVGTTLCITCGVLLCSKCHTHHRDSGLYKGHLQMTISTGKVGALLCVDHTKQFIQFYCSTCEQSVCRGCVHDTHSQHSVEEFIGSSSADLSVPQDIYTVLQDRLTDIPAEQDRVAAGQDRNLDDRQKVQACLEQVRNQRKKQAAHKKLLETLLKFHQKVEEDLDEISTKLIGEAEELRAGLKILHTLVYPISEYDHITPATLSLKAFQRQFSLTHFPTKKMDIFQEEYSKFISNPQNIVKHLKKIHEPKSVFADLDTDLINSKVALLWENNIEAYDVQFLYDGSKRIICTGQALLWRLHALDFDGKMIPIPDFLEPYAERQCRVVTSPVTSTITMTHRVFEDGLDLPFVTIDAEKNKVDGIIETLRDQNSLCSIASTRMKNVLFSFMDNRETPKLASIRCHTQTGEKMWYADVSGHTGDQAANTPYYLITDHLDRILVSDYMGGKVNIYDNSGRYLLTFPKKHDVPCISKDDCKPRPSGLCVDSKNNIFVAFPTHHIVSKFTPNGDFMQHILCTKGHPRSISLMNDKHLVIGVLGSTYMYDIQPNGADDDESDEENPSDVEDTDENNDDDVSDVNDIDGNDHETNDDENEDTDEENDRVDGSDEDDHAQPDNDTSSQSPYDELDNNEERL